MAMWQSWLLNFMEKSERPSTSQYPDFSKQFISIRCDSVPAVENTSDHTDITCFESYVARWKLTSEQRFQILTNHYTPPPNFLTWLLRYSWLEYIVQANGRFCPPCILFAVDPDGVDLGVLVSRWLTNCKKALEKVKNHHTTTTHQEVVTKTEHFPRVMHGQQEPAADWAWHWNNPSRGVETNEGHRPIPYQMGTAPWGIRDFVHPSFISGPLHGDNPGWVMEWVYIHPH